MSGTAGARGGKGRMDLTSGPILKTLLIFSLPALASNMLQSLNGTVNAIWVGRLLGEAALAATANANIVMFLVFAGVFGFGMAATVKIGQAFGARQVDAARRTFGTAAGFCGILAILVASIGLFSSPALLRVLATPPEAFPLALAYLRVIFLSMPAGMMTIMIAMGLNGSGDSRTPAKFMLLSVGLDIALNPLLIAGIGPFPEMGIAGSATATATATYVTLFALVGYLYWRDMPLRLRGAELRYLIPARAELGYIVTKGLPMGAQMLLLSSAGLVMVGLVNREGVDATAAYGASMQLWSYLQMPAMAISAGVSAMAAQAIGAGLTERLERTTGSGIVLNLAITGLLTALLLLFDRPLLVLFLGPDSPAVPLARHIQFLASWSFLFFGMTIVFFGTMRAGGAVIAPLVVLAIAMFPVRLGFVFLTREWLGQDALWLAFPVGSLAAVLLAWIAYRRPGWRDRARAVPPAEAAEEAQADGEPAGRMTPSL